MPLSWCVSHESFHKHLCNQDADPINLLTLLSSSVSSLHFDTYETIRSCSSRSSKELFTTSSASSMLLLTAITELLIEISFSQWNQIKPDWSRPVWFPFVWICCRRHVPWFPALRRHAPQEFPETWRAASTRVWSSIDVWAWRVIKSHWRRDIASQWLFVLLSHVRLKRLDSQDFLAFTVLLTQRWQLVKVDVIVVALIYWQRQVWP